MQSLATFLQLRHAFLLSALCAVILPALLGQNVSFSEYDVKAAYLYDFAHSAEWPNTNVFPDNSPFVIGVAGEDQEFLNRLRKVLEGRSVGTHTVTAKVVESEKEMRACQMVFFHAEESPRQTATIASLRTAGVLLVGEEPSFLRNGGMINLYLHEGRVRFELNESALQRAGIRLSPVLVQLASPDKNTPAAVEGLRHVLVSNPPAYPDLARRLNLKGSVHLEAIVRRDGTVKNTRILGGNPVLADAVQKAVVDWKYEPWPRETAEQIEYNFAQ